MLITIVIPVYNSANTIKKLVDKIVAIIDSYSLQIVLVNDGSNDNSHDVCLVLSLEYSSIIKYINLSRNFGEHNAVIAGLNYADGDYVIIMDDDFQNPPEEICSLIREALEHQYDIVFTYYREKQHHWLRNFGSWFNDKMATILLDKPRDLYLSSFKCLSRFVVKEIIKYTGPYPYIDGLALRCTRRIGKIQVQHKKREDGRSGYTFRKLVHLWLNMFVNFSVIPLRISSLLGILFSFLGVIVGVVTIMEKMYNPKMPMGWPSLIITVIVFSGVQLLILGFLGEYLGRMFLSYNQTPQFIVREIHQGSIKENKHG